MERCPKCKRSVLDRKMKPLYAKVARGKSGKTTVYSFRTSTVKICERCWEGLGSLGAALVERRRVMKPLPVRWTKARAAKASKPHARRPLVKADGERAPRARVSPLEHDDGMTPAQRKKLAVYRTRRANQALAETNAVVAEALDRGN